MAELDLAIRGGTVVTAADSYRADIGVRAGRIVAIGERIEGAAEEIDASRLMVLPGGVDAHVHLAQPSGEGVVMADDFASGTRAAAAGGNTTVLPFALQEIRHHGADYTPYEGLEVTGWPVMTILRGRVVASAGRVVGEPGCGGYLSRGLPGGRG